MNGVNIRPSGGRPNIVMASEPVTRRCWKHTSFKLQLNSISERDYHGNHGQQRNVVITEENLILPTKIPELRNKTNSVEVLMYSNNNDGGAVIRVERNKWSVI